MSSATHQKESSTASFPATSAPAWQADLGDGTYKNPVLFADYSDPDVTRVGDDYWMTSSSFGHVPGLPILHSRDLVNWTLVNHALPALVPVAHFSQPRHGQGVWAPAIRHHAGKFWIFFPDPDFGIYVITADDPRGRWSEPVMVKEGKGLIDPCPLWDDDGQAYLIHAWAKSRSGIKNRLTLHKMSPDGTRMLDAGVVIIDGDTMEGWNTIEGPKLSKHGGFYYVFAPAGGVRDGYQAVFRSRDIYGPYENRIVLEQGSTPVNGPHQGAWVDTPTGEHWFFHFQENTAYGRVVHLQPMEWHDGWPRMGDRSGGRAIGQPVIVHKKPALPKQPIAIPATSDEFDSPTLGLQWQWQANPQNGWTSLNARPGCLRLACVPRPAGETFWTAPNLLMQKFPAPAFEASMKLEFSPASDGEAAGLVIFGYSYAWLGLRRQNGATRLVLVTCSAANQGGAEREEASVAVDSGSLVARVSVADGGSCQFAYEQNGHVVRIGPAFQASCSMWVGAKVGMFATSMAATASTGHADIDWFRVAAR